MTFVVDGTNGLTFNDATTQSSTATNASNISSGTLGKARLPTGSVLQVVTANTSTEVSTSSTSFVTTGLSASITPSSSTSKVLILINAPISTGSTNVCRITVYRSSTNLGTSGGGFGRLGASVATTGIDAFCSLNYVDSPSTTSSTTYTVYYNTGSGSVYFSSNNATSTITLMEVSA